MTIDPTLVILGKGEGQEQEDLAGDEPLAEDITYDDAKEQSLLMAPTTSVLRIFNKDSQSNMNIFFLTDVDELKRYQEVQDSEHKECTR